jgi:uncharacterized membrane protein YphA (DoxX/SURF4 family)
MRKVATDSRLQHRGVLCYLLSAGAILLFSGCAKLLTVLQRDRILEINDPLFGIPFHRLFSIAGIAELVVGLIVLISRVNSTMRAGVVLWTATVILIYRLSLKALDYKSPCACLGTFSDVIGISPDSADILMKLLLSYLIIGSFLILFRSNDLRRRVLPVSSHR